MKGIALGTGLDAAWSGGSFSWSTGSAGLVELPDSRKDSCKCTALLVLVGLLNCCPLSIN